MPRSILLDGQRLTRRDFSAVVLRSQHVGLSPRARVAMQKSRAWVEKIIAEKQVAYGVTTGVGSLSTEHIDPAAARELQLNVVRSHSCGVGEPLGAAEQARELVRTASPHIAKDRPLHADIARVAGLISEGVLAGLIAPDHQF